MNELHKTVHFNDEVIIIEYDVNDRICKKDNFLKQIIKTVTNFFKRKHF
jgi:hypothetical protein